MNIDHFIVYINPKIVNQLEGVIAEVDIYLTPSIGLRGFKYMKPGGWSIPKYYSYLTGEKTVEDIINKENKEVIVKALTNCLSSVKMVLTSDSYGKKYLVNSNGSTLIG